MPASGYAQIAYASKAKTVARVRYHDELKLAELTLTGDLDVTMRLRADELDKLIAEASKVLAAMSEDPHSIGHTALVQSRQIGLDRLEHVLNRGAL